VSDTSVTRNIAVGSEGFRVGRVLSKSLTVLTGNFSKYVLFGAVIALPNLIAVFISADQVSTAQPMRPGQVFSSAAIFGGVAYGIIWLVVFSICQSALIYGAFQDVRGRPFDIGASVQRGLSRFLPVIGAAICAGILVGIGFVLFVIPGLILLTMFFVIVPVCVVEGMGPIQSLGRSSTLTKGYRWRIFAIYLVPGLIIAIAAAVLERIGLGIAGLLGNALAAYVVTAVGGAYQAIVNIVTYHDLRAVKEGLDIEQLAAVFD
jgi:hypothetical protein